MKKFIVISIFMFIILSSKVYAQSPSIKNMDVQVTVLENGDLKVNQVIDCIFDVNTRQLTIPIPYRDVEILGVKEINASKQYQKTQSKNVQNKERYIIEQVLARTLKGDLVPIRTILTVYPQANSINERIEVNYILKNQCDKYENFGRVSFIIKDDWESNIEVLNMNIQFPNNPQDKDLIAESLGAGKLNIIDNRHISSVVNNNIGTSGRTASIEVIFDLENIKHSTKETLTSEYYESKIDKYNKEKEKQNKKDLEIQNKMHLTQKLNQYAIVGIVILAVYWLVLLYKYEHDKKYIISNIDEDELFKRFNPLLAGCIENSRTVVSRDIVAVILNLVNKKVVDLEIRNILDKKDNYEYILTAKEDSGVKMDGIERYIYNWIFENGSTVNLAHRLKEIPKDNNIKKKFEKLNELATEELNHMGANKNKVPKTLQVINNILLVLSIMYAIIAVIYSADAKPLWQVVMEVGMVGVIVIPAWIMFSSVITAFLRKFSNRILPGSPRWITTAVVIPFTVIVICFLLFGQTLLFIMLLDETVTYITIVQYVLLISIAAIIAFTDDIMLKNDARMIEYHSKLYALKQKIQNSLLYDKDVEHIKLWDNYFTYAISFGITKKVTKRIEYIDLDNDLLDAEIRKKYKL